MLERKDDLQCTVSATEVRDDSVTLHCNQQTTTGR